MTVMYFNFTRNINLILSYERNTLYVNHMIIGIIIKTVFNSNTAEYYLCIIQHFSIIFLMHFISLDFKFHNSFLNFQ